MKKSIQLDVMKRDDALRKVKPDTGVTPRIEKLIDYFFEITGIRVETREMRSFCNEYPKSNFEDLKSKLKSNYPEILSTRDTFIKKWILECYEENGGNHSLKKYIIFLKLAAKESLKYSATVRCDWKNKKFIKIAEKPLSDAEKFALKIFLKTELPLEILNKIEKNFELCKFYPNFFKNELN